MKNELEIRAELARLENERESVVTLRGSSIGTSLTMNEIYNGTLDKIEVRVEALKWVLGEE